MSKYKYPVYRPNLSGNERQYVFDCIESSWISSKGEYVDRFERQFADFVGTRFAACVSNGTVAIHLALLAVGVKDGDEVVVPTFTYVAAVNAIKYCNATAVFVDSTAAAWQMNAAEVERCITPKTKAILAVHLYGHPCDMRTLRAIAIKHRVAVVEDCAEAFGAYIGDTHVGVDADVATFSFFGNKTITTGEGGMVICRDRTIFERIVHMKGQGLAKNREYWHDVIGYNYRMTNVCAAIGVAQLERATFLIEKKREIHDWYETEIKRQGVPFELQSELSGYKHSFWMIAGLVRTRSERDVVRAHLRDAGIETRPAFYLVNTMPMYEGSGRTDYPVADDLSSRGMNLPSYPDLNRADICEIVSSLGRAPAK